MAFIEPCFGIGHNLSLICLMTSEDIKHQLIIISTPITPRLASQKSFTTKYTHHTSACRSSHSRKCTHHTSALQTSRSPQSTPITDRPANQAIPESTPITHFILPCHHKVHPSHTSSCHAAPMQAEIAQGRILFKRRTSILTFLAFSSV